MKKLPEKIEPREVNNNTYTYRDAMEMIEDMRRLRRATGWFTSWIGTSTHFTFHMIEVGAENPDLEFFAQFEIKVKDVQLHLWPGKYPNDPSVPLVRQWFLSKRGPAKIASMVNDVVKETQLPDTASRWSRLLGDDELV